MIFPRSSLHRAPVRARVCACVAAQVVSLYDVEAPPSDPFRDVYLVTELMETDLGRVIASRQPLSADHTQYFMYQVCHCV